MHEYIIATLDGILRRHPDCGIILIGDFNQLRDMFLRTQYGFAQLVNTATRNSAILDKLWTNMDPVYDRFRFRLILFCQHKTFSNNNVYTNNEIIKYDDMEAPIKGVVK